MSPIINQTLPLYQLTKQNISERKSEMNTQTGSEFSIQTKKSKFRIVFPIVILLIALAIALFLAANFKVITLSGKGETYVLDAGKTQLGILFIEDDATAIFREKSHWIGPVISKEGALIIQDDVTITGSVYLFSNPLALGKNATVKGSVYDFAGGLELRPGASVRHNVVLFAGDLTLQGGASIHNKADIFSGNWCPEEMANIRGDVVLFAGNVNLHEKSSLRGDAVLFAGDMRIGDEATMYGKLISFAGGLELASKAILYDDAVLFSGNAHLYPTAEVRGDVLLAQGNAKLEGQSTISGKLYLNPESTLGPGHLYSASEAQVIRGIIKTESIEAVAGSRIAGLFLGYAILFLIPPVVVVCLLMALMFHLGRHSRAPKDNVGTKTRYTQPSSQPATPGMR